MRNKREHTRLDLAEMQGKMTLASKVEIVDISLGGVAVKADKIGCRQKLYDPTRRQGAEF